MTTVDQRLASRAKERSPSPIRELMPYLSIPGMISLGGGYPNPETFVFRKLGISFKSGRTQQISGADAIAASQYGPTSAHRELGPTLLQWHKHKDGVTLSEQELLVLNGSQEGLFIMAYLFLEQDDCVVVSDPVYPGASGAVSAFCRNFIAAPLDAHGMDTARLEKRLRELQARGDKLPKFVYTVPSGHNPGGVTMSLERRKHLLTLAELHDFLILEDDPYQLVQLEDEETLPTLQALEGEPRRVIRLDSFSKIFAPGLRLGYATAHADIIRQFVLFKQYANLHTSMLVQAMLHSYLKEHGFDEFRAEIKANCLLYRNNRDAMVEAARAYLPPEVTFNIPGHGMFIWFILPSGFDAERMIRQDSEALKVLLVPGAAFAIDTDLKNCMRASFSMVEDETIREGMRRFAQMISREGERIEGERLEGEKS